MSEAKHEDASMKWLIFFLVVFTLTVFGIGFTAIFTYNANPPEPATQSGGHGSMILPQDGEYAPHARVFRIG